jgi:hypothetical protein
VVVVEGCELLVLVREIDVVAVHLKLSLWPDGELIIRWSQVQILAGPPFLFNQLDCPFSWLFAAVPNFALTPFNIGVATGSRAASYESLVLAQKLSTIANRSSGNFEPRLQMGVREGGLSSHNGDG